jgi:hypothetical protein
LFSPWDLYIPGAERCKSCERNTLVAFIHHFVGGSPSPRAGSIKLLSALCQHGVSIIKSY